MSRAACAALTAALALCLAACAAPLDSPTASPITASGDAPPLVTLNVFAASSLTDAFGEIETQFEQAFPSIDVVYSFAGSADLAAQISEGAPADVFASADEAQMEAVGTAIPKQFVFASNTMTMAVPAGNPLALTDLADLAEPGLKLVVCAPVVPCGAATGRLADAQGVVLTPVSEEANVTDVLGKVASGEADVGIVYVTDVGRVDGLESVAIAGAGSVVNYYPIGALADSDDPDAANAFVAWVTGVHGQAVLGSFGFGAP